MIHLHWLQSISIYNIVIFNIFINVHNIICLMLNFFFYTIIKKYSLLIQCYGKYSHIQINVVMTAHNHKVYKY